MCAPQLNKLCASVTRENLNPHAAEHSYGVLVRANDKSAYLPARGLRAEIAQFTFSMRNTLQRKWHSGLISQKERAVIYSRSNRTAGTWKFRAGSVFLELMDFTEEKQRGSFMKLWKYRPCTPSDEKCLSLEQHHFMFNLFSLVPQRPSYLSTAALRTNHFSSASRRSSLFIFQLPRASVRKCTMQQHCLETGVNGQRWHNTDWHPDLSNAPACSPVTSCIKWLLNKDPSSDQTVLNFITHEYQQGRVGNHSQMCMVWLARALVGHLQPLSMRMALTEPGNILHVTMAGELRGARQQQPLNLRALRAEAPSTTVRRKEIQYPSNIAGLLPCPSFN